MKTLAFIACVGFSCAALGAALDLQPQIDAAAAKGGGTVCVPAGDLYCRQHAEPFISDSAFHGAYYTIFDTIIVPQNDTAAYCAGSGKMLIYAQPNRRKRQ